MKVYYVIQKRGNKYHARIVSRPQDWQSEAHTNERRRMNAIMTLAFHKNMPNAPREINAKILMVVKRLEQYLYLSADSLEDYKNMKTLPFRMKGYKKMVERAIRRCF